MSLSAVEIKSVETMRFLRRVSLKSVIVLSIICLVLMFIYDLKRRNLKLLSNYDQIEIIQNNIKGLNVESLVNLEEKEVKMEIIKLPVPQNFKVLYKTLGIQNPGHMGKPVIIKNKSRQIEQRIKDGWNKFEFNEFVSSLIPLDRELPDIRTDYCKNEIYSNNLPKASIIIIFHNEAWSMLLRTMHSILNRSPENLIEEITLVDDCSEMSKNFNFVFNFKLLICIFKDHLKKPLDDYIAEYPKVKLVRSPVRLGLMKARMTGAVNSKGPVLIFMDSHFEVTTGWLEPLLDRIARNKNTTVLPTVDGLDSETFEYGYNSNPNTYAVGGFDWSMTYEWKPIPESEKIKHKDPSEPILTPTMLGAFFAIDKEYFELLGMYDPEFDIWGAENLELSFKVWMCGGTMEMIPCSHAGHMYRKRQPYTVSIKVY